jgi:hypothetical protein
MPNDRAARAHARIALGCACLLVAGTILTACKPDADTAATANPPIDPATTMNPADLKDVTASYRCDQGHRIDIVRDRVARVALADGRVIKIEAVQDSAPRTFMDNGLTFTLSPQGATLDDETGHTLACTPVPKP